MLDYPYPTPHTWRYTVPVNDETRLKRKFNDRAHNLITDPLQYTPDPYIADSPSDETRDRWARQARGYVQRQKAGWASPINHLIGLDLLLASAPPLLIRANRMANLLNDTHPHYQWHAMTIGRIMNQIYDTVIANIRDGDASLAKGRDWHGHYFIYDPSLPAIEIMWQMREWIGPRCTPYRNDADAALPTFVWADFVYNPENPQL
jgi:hypothetical protein